MALNKYIHPRNIYKRPPDFSQLAIKYSEFMKISKLDLNGKVHIDFKDPTSLRILTKCLLDHDFNLKVTIPDDRLVPTLPLRLNYILWMEDLLENCNRTKNVTGIDIGTGACAIYPLLAARKNEWQMIGTESDDKSYSTAIENVGNNQLDDKIQIKHYNDSTLIMKLFTDDVNLIVDFCMCNPPFYSSIEELFESRSAARPQPKNAFTGSPQELITEGGEVEFVKKLINESQQLTDRILIYTTMLGHKHSLKILKDTLKALNIKNTHTEFCQGRTTRWGLAWTFSHINLEIIVPPRKEIRKKNSGMCFNIPSLQNKTYDVDTVTKTILDILKPIRLIPSIVEKRGAKLSLEFKAYENMWSNQRRKRREMKRLIDESTMKVRKINNEFTFNDGRGNSENTSVDKDTKHSQIGFRTDLETDVTKTSDVEKSNQVDLQKSNVEGNDVRTTQITENICQNECKEFPINSIVKESNNNKVESNNVIDIQSCSSNFQSPILHFLMSIMKSNENIVLELAYLNGTEGKDGLHQVLQYIRNKWK